MSAPPLARAWVASLSGQAVQLVLQAASFVLLARFLGAQAFGWRVALGAVALMAGPFVGVGSSNVLIRNVARQPATFAESWGNALLVTAASGLILAVACVPVSRAVLAVPLPSAILAAVLVSDLALTRVVALAAAAFQARGRTGAMARTGTSLQAARLFAIVACIWAAPTARIEWWATATLAASSGAAAVTIWAACRDLGRPAFSGARLRREWPAGVPFVLSPYTQAVTTDADKLVLGWYALPEVVGAYGAAYRALTVACTPLHSLLAVTYPLSFQHGTEGIAAARRFAWSVSVHAVAAGLVATLAVFAGSGLVAKALGAGFEETAVILRWLCVLPTLKAAQFLFADALTGAGFQGRRVGIQAGVAGLNLVLNLALIPSMGWAGAAGATLASEMILAVGLGAATIRPRRPGPATPVGPRGPGSRDFR